MINERYIVQAVGFEIYPEEDGKAPSVKVELRVVEGPEAGKTIFHYCSLHENAQQYSVEALRTLGWRCNDLTALEGLGEVKAIAVGKQETYKGKVQTRYMIFAVKTPKPTLEADAKASFAARFKALAASVAPVERTDLNKAGAVPAAVQRTATPGAVTPSNGTTGPVLF